jgi:Flp pilus assembly protein TadD
VNILSLALAGVLLCVPVRASTEDDELLSIQQAIQSGNLDRASQLIDASLSRHPNEGGFYNLRGIVHAQRNELPQAHAAFAEAVRLSPRLTPAWQNLARACRLEAEANPSALTCAISASEHVLQWKPSDPEALSSLAALYERKGQFAASLRELAKLSGPDASQKDNLLLRCADLAALGRTAEAMPLASDLARNPEFSENDLVSLQSGFDGPKAASVLVALVERLDARQAAGLSSLRMLTIAYEQTGRPQEARKTLERVALLDPKNPAHLLELARLAEAAKDHEGALGYLAHARDLAPGDAHIHFLFAMVATELELPVEARASLERALAIDPASPAYNYAMGTVILTTRDAATASRYFKKALDARPHDEKGRYALGVAYYAAGDYANSKTEMLSVENNPKLAGGAAYFLGRIARRENDAESAERYLRKAIKLMPGYAEPHTELARVCLLKDDLAGTRTELDRALQLDPRSFQANTQLLVLYKRMHDPLAGKQAELVKQLDEDRSRHAELMLRTIELRP